MIGGHIVMDTCTGCKLRFPTSKLYTCDCPKKETCCMSCLRKHANRIHMEYYQLPDMLKKKRSE